MSLVVQIGALAAAIRSKLNLMTPRLPPAGGATGQALVKVSGADFDLAWATVSGGGGQAPNDNLTRLSSSAAGMWINSFDLYSTDGVNTYFSAGSFGLETYGQFFMPAVEGPLVPVANTVSLFGRKIAGRILPAYIGPSGLDSALQPFMARNKVGYFNPAGNQANSPGIFGFVTPTTTGFTLTARNVAVTNQFTRFRRLGYVTAATVGAVGQWRTGAAQFTLGDGAGMGGFNYILRFGISDSAPVAGARMFMGMRANITPSNVEPSTLNQGFGLGHGASDTNLKFYYGGSSAQTPIDLGVNFPITGAFTEMYEMALFASPNDSNLIWQVTRLSTGDVAGGTIINTYGAILPASTYLLGCWGFRTNNATALAVAIDVASAYLETDY